MHSTVTSNARREVLRYIRRNWFDIGTMVWAIGLLVVGILWVATPAFAAGGGDDPDCGLVCSVACDSNDGCESYIPGRGGCEVYCMDGTHYRCIAS